jgi:hypothetical protein
MITISIAVDVTIRAIRSIFLSGLFVNSKEIKFTATTYLKLVDVSTLTPLNFFFQRPASFSFDGHILTGNVGCGPHATLFPD